MTSVIDFSVHPHLFNKPPQWQPDFASDWHLHSGSLDDLRSHVTAGGAFIPAAMNSPHRNSAAFLHSDLAVVDIDNGLTLAQFLAHPLAQQAAFVYTTASHAPPADRYRIVFRLPRRITEGDLLKAVTTLLTRALGGDQACTDPCRLFYGCSTAEVPLWQPEATLTPDILVDARAEARAAAVRHSTSEAAIYDDKTINRAIFVLEQVIRPSEDGERDRFIRVTAAASAGGEAVCSAWQNWATRCHHTTGHRARQGTERYFNSFNGRSSLGTLFFFANEDDPNWRDLLPEELRGSEGDSFARRHGAAGYDHEDFLGDPSDIGWDEYDAQFLRAKAAVLESTPSLFSTDRPWTVVAEVDSQPSSAHPAPGTSYVCDDEDDDDCGGYDAPGEQDPMPEPRRPERAQRGRPQRDDAITTIRDRLLRLYPGLRLNAMSQDLEYGSLSNPSKLSDPSTVYVRISAGTGSVFPKSLVHDTAQIIGYENRINPVQGYLSQCAANEPPCPYFKALASELLGLPEDPLQAPRFTSGPDAGRFFADVAMERFLIGAVARALNPGCIHDWMPIFIGGQNSGKSTFLQYLTPPAPGRDNLYPWTTTVQQSIRQIKDKPHILHCGWLVNLDECERYFRRQYVEEFKNLVSTPVDRSARKYENERNFERSFVLCGATNSTDFLIDPTGNRRFIPIPVVGKVPSPQNPRLQIIDLDRLKRDRDSIWAAAYLAYQDNPVHTFTSYELSVMGTYIAALTADSPLEARLEKMLTMRSSGIYRGVTFVTISDIYEWLDIPVDRQHSIQLAVCDALKHLGYRNLRVRIAGEIRRIWTKLKLNEPAEASDPSA
jgi:hypothetical protein